MESTRSLRNLQDFYVILRIFMESARSSWNLKDLYGICKDFIGIIKFQQHLYCFLKNPTDFYGITLDFMDVSFHWICRTLNEFTNLQYSNNVYNIFIDSVGFTWNLLDLHEIIQNLNKSIWFLWNHQDLNRINTILFESALSLYNPLNSIWIQLILMKSDWFS